MTHTTSARPRGEFGPLDTWDAYRRLEAIMRLRPAMGTYLEVRDGRPRACGFGALALAAGHPGHELMGDYPSNLALRKRLGVSLAYNAGYTDGFDGQEPDGTSLDWGFDYPDYLRGHFHGRAAAMLEGLIPLPLRDPDARNA